MIPQVLHARIILEVANQSVRYEIAVVLLLLLWQSNQPPSVKIEEGIQRIHLVRFQVSSAF